MLWWPWVYIAGAYLYHYYTLCTLDTHCYDDPGYTLLVLINITSIPYVPWIHIVMMTLGIHCWCLSISLYRLYPGYILLWLPRVYIAGAYLYHYYTLCTQDTHCYDDPGYTLLVLINITIIPYVLWIHIVMMSLGIHCWCLSISLLYLMYPGYTLLWWPWIYIACAYLYHYTLCTLDTHCFMMTQCIHCWCLSVSLYLMYPVYTLLWCPLVYIAGAYQYHYYTLCTLDTHCYDAYLYHYTFCTLDTHCYDDPWYTLLVLIYITSITYVPWIHIVMMTLGIHIFMMYKGIHCWCLSMSLYLMYPGYTLLWWPRVYIAGAYLYHYYTLRTQDTHCYDDPWYTLLVLINITIIPYVLWIHIVMMSLGIHCWCLSISLLYLMYPGYTLLWWPWIYIACAYLYHYTLCTLDTHCYDDPGYTVRGLNFFIIIPYVPCIHIIMMTLGIHCWCLSISLVYLMYPGYTLLWWPWVYIAGGYLYLFTLCTLDTHCYDDPGYTLLVLINITIIPYVPRIQIVIMTLGIHCWCLSISLLYLMYSGYTLLWWAWVYIAGAYLYHFYSLCTLDTHCYDDPGYILLVLINITIIPYVLWIHIVMMLIYITIPYVPWIHIVMMTLGIHCWCLTLSLLYLMYPGYTLLCWPWVDIAGTYLYH